MKSVFVNVFGGITACDEVANGIIQALGAARASAARRSPSRWSSGSTATTPRPGRAILDGATNPLVERVDTMDGAAERAAELAAAGV